MFSEIIECCCGELDVFRLPLERIPVSHHKSRVSTWIDNILLSDNIRLTNKLTTLLQNNVERMPNPYKTREEIRQWCEALISPMPEDVNLILESYILLLFVLHLRFLYKKFPVSRFSIKCIAHKVSEAFIEALERKLQGECYWYKMLVILGAAAAAQFLEKKIFF
ncbi:hypothetical protein TNCT_729841 [Trichonephila clavata]|uniref:Uncharacterized protein n=1 Tax=Trichonephila clavata TaxID=2740835 RepID=A0A8X6HZL0_TRICU|nr:hypothetical protein TNCT_729841 [Trichonephila clavata]